MNPNIDPLIFTVALTLSAHTQAAHFSRQQSNPIKAKQVYLNTLAVYTINYYLKCLGYETDLEGSDSWDRLMQTLMNVADITIKNYGKLECRYLLPEAEFLSIPEEVWSNRIGYIAVQLDESLQQAKAIGFIEQVTNKEIPLKNLRSLDELPTYLNQFKQLEPTNLSQWRKNIFEDGWQVLENLFPSPQPVFNFRGSDRSTIARNQNPPALISRNKLLTLNPINEQVVLMVGLMPIAPTEMEVWVKLAPINGQTHLPPDLLLTILDGADEIVMQAQARSTETILLKFTGEVGELFTIQITLDDLSLKERFVI
jgi:hypothetical protein